MADILTLVAAVLLLLGSYLVAKLHAVGKNNIARAAVLITLAIFLTVFCGAEAIAEAIIEPQQELISLVEEI